MPDPCARCGADLWPLRTGPVTLYGGVVCVLCAACRTDWHAYVLGHPAARERVILAARETYLCGLVQAQQPPDEAAWQAFAEAQQANEDTFFALGQAWLARPDDLGRGTDDRTLRRRVVDPATDTHNGCAARSAPMSLKTLNTHLQRLGLHLTARELVAEPRYAVLDVDPSVAQLVVDVAAACRLLGSSRPNESHAATMFLLSYAVVPGVRVLWHAGQYWRGEG